MPKNQEAYLAKGSEERRQSIADRLLRDGFASNLQLAQAFSVSEMTIRRDVTALEEQGLVRRVHGGATGVSASSFSPTDFRQRIALNSEKKNKIALKALTFLQRGDIIAIDSGSSTLGIAQYLPDNLNITVVTNSLPALTELAMHKKIKVFAIGGELHTPTLSFSSIESAKDLNEFRFTTYFLSVGSIKNNMLYCATPYEAMIKKSLIESSDQVILLADSSKFSSDAMVKVCDLSQVSIFITDGEVKEEQRKEIRKYCKLEIVN
jgi:DeoR family transcriptional regulator of aga operon/DeoR family myo-inositol catabolism operon transcriptional repressor